MFNKTLLSKMPSKRRFTVFLSFLLVAFSAIYFSACRKESVIDSFSQTNQLKNPITADDAQGWFQNKFGESHLIAPPNNSTSFAGDTSKNKDEYFFEEPFEIKPLWSSAEISSYLKVNSIVLVPVYPIPILDKKEMQYAMVVFRDSLGSLNARLQAYRATNSYKKSHTSFSVDDFSGMFFQIGMDGRMQNIYAIDNGVVKNRIYIGRNQNIGKGLKGQGAGCHCFDGGPGAGILDEVWCMLT